LSGEPHSRSHHHHGFHLQQEEVFMAGKGDVITAIAEQAGISKKEAAAAFDAFVGYISDSCTRGERCAIPGLGSFSITSRKAREGRNPRTNEKITIPASKNVRFKAGKDLRDAVNTKRGGKSGRR
jgi:DNA-binding protein HU-beta